MGSRAVRLAVTPPGAVVVTPLEAGKVNPRPSADGAGVAGEAKGDDGGLALLDGETRVLEAKPAPFELQVPAPPGLAEAKEAGHRLDARGPGHPTRAASLKGLTASRADGLWLFMGGASADADLPWVAWTRNRHWQRAETRSRRRRCGVCSIPLLF